MNVWTADEQRAVARALLGSWPGTVTAWGKDAFAAYIDELRARGLTADRVLVAVRTWPAGSDFPPSAPNLAAAARNDPSKPTFEEAYRLIYGPGGILRAQPVDRTFPDGVSMARAYNEARTVRAGEVHPLVGSFAVRFGLERLGALEVDHPEYGGLKRKELREAWDRHCEAMEGRDVAALVSGERRGELGRFDPLAVVGRRPVGIGSGGE